jgi:hypothetical protein
MLQANKPLNLSDAVRYLQKARESLHSHINMPAARQPHIPCSLVMLWLLEFSSLFAQIGFFPGIASTLAESALAESLYPRQN